MLLEILHSAKSGPYGVQGFEISCFEQCLLCFYIFTPDLDNVCYVFIYLHMYDFITEYFMVLLFLNKQIIMYLKNM